MFVEYPPNAFGGCVAVWSKHIRIADIASEQNFVLASDGQYQGRGGSRLKQVFLADVAKFLEMGIA